MSRIFVIPDVHLKPWIYDRAAELVSESEYDTVVMLGDIADDWNQGFNVGLYKDTYEAAGKFATEHPNTYWCYGNHDISYVWQLTESGYSHHARKTAVEGLESLKAALPEGHAAFLIRFDDTLFSHAGLFSSFVERYFHDPAENDIDKMISTINSMGPDKLWMDDSPIWARPHDNGLIRTYPEDYFQVVGHTPVSKPVLYDNLLVLDTFSTYSNGRPIGNGRFACVDTKTHEFFEI